MFSNLSIFKLGGLEEKSFADLHEQLTSALDRFSVPTGKTPEDFHWIPPSSDAGIVYAIDGFFLICLKKIKKTIPGSLLQEELQKEIEKTTVNQGFRPGRKQVKEIKEALIDRLFTQVLAVPHCMYAMIDVKKENLYLDTKSESGVSNFIHQLSLCLERADVGITVNGAAELGTSSHLTEWLFNMPAQFELGKTVLIEQLGKSVKYNGQYSDEERDKEYVRQLIASGQKVSQLALEWPNYLSFMIDKNFNLSKIKLADVQLDGHGNKTMGEDEHERFRSDIALLATLYSALYDELKTAIDETEVA